MDFSPAIVIEAQDACGSPKAEAWVRESMRGSLAPRGTWTLRISSEGPTHLVGVLEDEAGRPVAHRDLFPRSARECEGTMHAVGVWASLVLDTEVERAHARERDEAAKVEAQRSQREAEEQRAAALKASIKLAGADDADAGVAARKHQPSIEVGVASMLASGLGGPTATYVGASAFVFVEAGLGLFLRPSATYGHSLATTDINWGSARFDFCARVPGNYTEHRGLQLDVCFGPEVGIMSLKGSVDNFRVRPLFGLGPTLSLRGELGNALAVEVRAASAYNIVHGEELDPIAPLSLRAEIGMSWGVR